MKPRMEPLRDLSSLKGLDKQWPAKGKLQFALVQDFLLKINYSIQDFNCLIRGNLFSVPRDIILMVVYVDWISDAVSRIKGCYLENVISSFRYSEQEQLDRVVSYFRAVRAFVVAHPLGTSRHSDFGLDGDLICVDIARQSRFLDVLGLPLRRISLKGGLEGVDSVSETDIVLRVYSKRNDALYSEHVCLDPEDIRAVAVIEIDYLFELGRYLNRLKKKDFLGISGRRTDG